MTTQPSSEKRGPTAQRNSPWRGFLTVGLLSLLLVIVILQWRALSQLREENNALRAQAKASPPPMTAPESSTSGALSAQDSEQLLNERLELLRLRNEVRQLREQTSSVTAQGSSRISAPPNTAGVSDQNGSNEARQLAIAAMRGDASALDKLASLAANIRKMKPEDQPAAIAAIKSAFEFLGNEAGKGDPSALKALWQASRVGGLQGFAAQGLGQAAGLGNEEALKPLLDPEAYHLLRSSAVAALKPAADAGNERAIQALANTASDPTQQALWLMAAQGLESAAAAGNSAAIDGLANIAAGTNQMLSKQALSALEAAARKNQPRAEEVLRKLGWR